MASAATEPNDLSAIQAKRDAELRDLTECDRQQQAARTSGQREAEAIWSVRRGNHFGNYVLHQTELLSAEAAQVEQMLDRATKCRAVWSECLETEGGVHRQEVSEAQAAILGDAAALAADWSEARAAIDLLAEFRQPPHLSQVSAVACADELIAAAEALLVEARKFARKLWDAEVEIEAWNDYVAGEHKSYVSARERFDKAAEALDAKS